MRKIWKMNILQVLGSIILLPVIFFPAPQAESDLIIHLNHPAQGETFYSGPTSLLYNIPIQGWVDSALYKPEEIQIQLEIYQDDQLVTVQEESLQFDGTFEFFATVNPENSTENFPATEADCASFCHYPTDLALPAGKVELRITAKAPDGLQDFMSREIIVDRSSYVKIPLQLFPEDELNLKRELENIPVSASTRLYLWRNRIFSTATDGTGFAWIELEALSEAATRYWVEVEPVIVDGIQYFSEQPVEVVLPPGGSSIQPISIQVQSRIGSVSGTIQGMQEQESGSLQIHFLDPVNGTAAASTTVQQGKFELEGIKLKPYLVLPVVTGGESTGSFVPEVIRVDLSQVPEEKIEFSFREAVGKELKGYVQNQFGQLLPFGQVLIDGAVEPVPVQPSTGEFLYRDAAQEQALITVSSPGYYSQQIRVRPSSSTISNVMLKPLPDLAEIPWGSGTIFSPAGNQYEIYPEGLEAARGWFWGQNWDPSSYFIRVGSSRIELSQGVFALKILPNQTTWFFQLEGSSRIETAEDEPPVKLQGGEMIALNHSGEFIPVSIKLSLLTALEILPNNALEPNWEPGLKARLRRSLFNLGVSGAQIITFITYGLIILSIVIIPFAALYSRYKEHKKQPT